MNLAPSKMKRKKQKGKGCQQLADQQIGGAFMLQILKRCTNLKQKTKGCFQLATPWNAKRLTQPPLNG
jgi:hypothetical protein